MQSTLPPSTSLEHKPPSLLQSFPQQRWIFDYFSTESEKVKPRAKHVASQTWNWHEFFSAYAKLWVHVFRLGSFLFREGKKTNKQTISRNGLCNSCQANWDQTPLAIQLSGALNGWRKQRETDHWDRIQTQFSQRFPNFQLKVQPAGNKKNVSLTEAFRYSSLVYSQCQRRRRHGAKMCGSGWRRKV